MLTLTTWNYLVSWLRSLFNLLRGFFLSKVAYVKFLSLLKLNLKAKPRLNLKAKFKV